MKLSTSARNFPTVCSFQIHDRNTALWRQKEFGIRKVVGASATQITRLHINHFIRVGLIANVIALPIAYFVMKGWLNGFAYKGEVSLFQFASFGILLLIFIALSAGYSAWKSGRMNPVDVIKAD